MIKHKVLKFLTLLAAVSAVCAIAAAQSNDEASEEKEILTTLEQRMLKRVSVDFGEMPIGNVIRIMAEQADVDIIISPMVTGNVTTTLTDVPLEEALSNILAAHGYGYIVGKNMIRIVPINEIIERPEMLMSRIYRITYTDVGEVEAALKKFISKRGSLSANPSTSNIIVTDTEHNIKAIDTFIDEIDRITPQILVEARIYDITTDEDFDLGIEWNAGRNSTERETIDPDTGTYTGVLTPDSTDYGVGQGSVGDASGKRDTKQRTSTAFVAGSYDELTGGSIRLGILNDAVDIDIALNILHEQDSAKLLANPRIMVLDNETALFEIIREIPYVESTALGGAGVTETVKFKEVGVKLVVTPHVTRDGMVRLHIMPEFGVRVGTGAGAPTVDTRKLDTIALVKDGQTVVLGGLRKNETTQDSWKVPLFGDIPLLGGLFQSETESTETTELVVFITPRIIEQPVMSETERKQYELTEFSGSEPTFTRAEKAAK